MATKITTTNTTPSTDAEGIAPMAIEATISLGDTIYVMPAEGLLVREDNDGYYPANTASVVQVSTRVVRLLNDGDLVQVAAPAITDAAASTDAAAPTSSTDNS